MKKKNSNTLADDYLSTCHEPHSTVRVHSERQLASQTESGSVQKVPVKESLQMHSNPVAVLIHSAVLLTSQRLLAFGAPGLNLSGGTIPGVVTSAMLHQFARNIVPTTATFVRRTFTTPVTVAVIATSAKTRPSCVRSSCTATVKVLTVAAKMVVDMFTLVFNPLAAVSIVQSDTSVFKNATSKPNPTNSIMVSSVVYLQKKTKRKPGAISIKFSATTVFKTHGAMLHVFTYVASGVSKMFGPPSVTTATRVLEEVLHVPDDAAHPPDVYSESSTTVCTFARSRPVFSTDNSENSTNSPVRVLLMTFPTTGGGVSGENETRLLLGITGSNPDPLMLKKYLRPQHLHN